MKKIMRQWKSELATSWDKFSFKGRIFMFAGISFILAYIYLNQMGHSLKLELEKVKKKAPKEAVSNPKEDAQIRDDNEKAERLKNSVNVWRQRVDAKIKISGVVNVDSVRRVMTDIQSVIGDCILEYCRKHVDKKKTGKLRRGSAIVETSVKVDEFVASEKFEYKVVGSYPQIRQFLEKLTGLGGFFEVENLYLSKVDEFKSAALVGVVFVVKINYLK